MMTLEKLMYYESSLNEGSSILWTKDILKKYFPRWIALRIDQQGFPDWEPKYMFMTQDMERELDFSEESKLSMVSCCESTYKYAHGKIILRSPLTIKDVFRRIYRLKELLLKQEKEQYGYISKRA